ncbi:hypothetical protein RUND412_009110 [Rhizina undulata]
MDFKNTQPAFTEHPKLSNSRAVITPFTFAAFVLTLSWALSGAYFYNRRSPTTKSGIRVVGLVLGWLYQVYISTELWSMVLSAAVASILSFLGEGANGGVGGAVVTETKWVAVLPASLVGNGSGWKRNGEEVITKMVWVERGRDGEGRSPGTKEWWEGLYEQGPFAAAAAAATTTRDREAEETHRLKATEGSGYSTPSTIPRREDIGVYDDSTPAKETETTVANGELE